MAKRPHVTHENFYSFTEMDFDTGCLIWTRAVDTSGYGQMRIGKKMNTHRFAWMLEKGPIPPGMCVCHKCDTPACVNVDHLFLASQHQNIRDMDRKGRRGTPKTKGHPRLTKTQVLEIRQRLAAGESIIGVARAFGYQRQQIRRIRDRVAWVHIP